MDVQSESPALKKVHWTEAEDAILFHYVKQHGEGRWNAVAQATGLDRCGKSCRNRWLNHLKPNLKKGPITPEEEQLIIQLQAKMGNKWAHIVKHLPGRTDNEIKNFWNCKKKRLKSQGVIGAVPLRSLPPVLDPSNVVHQHQQQRQQDECSPLVDLSLPRLVALEHGVPVRPSVPDIVGHYLHPGAIGQVMEMAVGMLQSRGIIIPNSLPRVPAAPSPLPTMSMINMDPQDPWAPLPTMPVANVDPLAPPQLPIVSVDDPPAPFSSSMTATVNVDIQVSWAPLPTMAMTNVDPLPPPQFPIVSVGDPPTPFPSPMTATVNMDPQAPWAPLPMTLMVNVDRLVPPQVSVINVDPQAPWAPLPMMSMVNEDPLPPSQLPMAGVDHRTPPPSLSTTPTVGVDPLLDNDVHFDFDMDMMQSILDTVG